MAWDHSWEHVDRAHFEGHCPKGGGEIGAGDPSRKDPLGQSSFRCRCPLHLWLRFGLLGVSHSHLPFYGLSALVR
jgi:hypothetical protein